MDATKPSLPRLLLRLTLGRRLPVTDGVLTVPAGPAAEVTVRRDRYGIPHIEAADEHDAWYALGFCIGQDRSFQMETLLRLVRGTLAALVGRDAVPIDRLTRRIGFRRAAEVQWGLLDEELRLRVAAYVEGVNAGRAHGCRGQAHELALLRARPTPLEPEDVLGVLGLESCLNAMNWDTELARWRILRTDGPDALAALEPAYPEWLPVTSPPRETAGPAADRLAEDVAALRAVATPGTGSNNWVLAGSRTTSGRPLLAGDEHLANDLPPIWYLAHIRTPEWEAAGRTIGPAFVGGHNDRAAWAETNGYADNSDLVLEELGPDGRSIRRGDQLLDCTVLEEVIEVRRGKPVVERVMVTPDGPVIGPALDGDLGAIALRATWLHGGALRGLFSVHRARSFEEFRRCFDPWPAISLNMVYADTSGTIGWQLTGDVPRRRRGHGLVPVSGADGEPWLPDRVPFEDMPHAQDPDCGFLATANNKPVVDGDGSFLGADWLDGFRVRRITDRLAARSDWDVASTQALQTDVHSGVWDDVRDIVLAAPTDDPDAALALRLLRSWDGEMRPGSVAATVFERFVLEMSERILRAKAPHAVAVALGSGANPLMSSTSLGWRRAGRLVRLLREQPDGWFRRGWDGEVAGALAWVVTGLRVDHGDDPGRWALGHVRPLVLRHPLGRVRGLHSVLDRGPLAVTGDSDTVLQCSQDTFTPGVFVIPSARMVIDVGDWDASRFSLPGGQSGNPLSPHYDDLLRHWTRGTGVPLAWSPDAVARATTEMLRLVPAEE